MYTQGEGEDDAELTLAAAQGGAEGGGEEVRREEEEEEERVDVIKGEVDRESAEKKVIANECLLPYV